MYFSKETVSKLVFSPRQVLLKHRNRAMELHPRVLFPKAPGGQTQKDQTTELTLLQNLFKEKNEANLKEFRERWCFDPVSESPIEGGAWKWQPLKSAVSESITLGEQEEDGFQQST